MLPPSARHRSALVPCRAVHLCCVLSRLSPSRKLQSLLPVSFMLNLHHLEWYLAHKRVKLRPAPLHWDQVISSGKGTFSLAEGYPGPSWKEPGKWASQGNCTAASFIRQRRGPPLCLSQTMCLAGVGSKWLCTCPPPPGGWWSNLWGQRGELAASPKLGLYFPAPHLD